MLFETGMIYALDDRGELAPRRGNLELDDDTLTHQDIERPFLVTGLHRGDIAVFGHAIDEEDVTECSGLLVLETHKAMGVVALDDTVVRDPACQTSELARKMLQLDDDTINELNLGELIAIMRQKFPEIHSRK